MQINADLSVPVNVESAELEWVATRKGGVERKMLERNGAESGRATTIVRFAPESYFDWHNHDGGEEFIVLEGIFSDEMGDFGPGCYVRNPKDSRHKPHSAEGCTIMVKLWQMVPDDQEYVRVQTNTAEWVETEAEGVKSLPLYSFDTEAVTYYDLDAGSSITLKAEHDGFEAFVVTGEVSVNGSGLGPRGWTRLPGTPEVTLASDQGARVYVKTGHLTPETIKVLDQY